VKKQIPSIHLKIQKSNLKNLTPILLLTLVPSITSIKSTAKRLAGTTTDHVSCKCEECVMIIERNGNRFELVDAEIEVPFLKEFNQHISEVYKANDEISITEIEIQTSGESKAVQFDFLVNNLVADDVIIVSERGKIYKVSCDGSCDCRSRFQFDPPTASCSCEDCVLTVEELD